jgi:hypothetical protein
MSYAFPFFVEKSQDQAQGRVVIKEQHLLRTNHDLHERAPHKNF